ncbi:hypothetical protein M434DRAFT_38928 [Hypoxylon sp. CO27-5]|nr:hypothetical protein M434DRAFT_38928 [Hypoxylon sp. CO27-5]
MASGNDPTVGTNDKQYPSSIVKVPQADHPLYAQFMRNTSNPFISLPIEVRLIIYEYAVAINKKITVHHVTRRSNKFLWGEKQLDTRSSSSSSKIWSNSEQQPLAVLSLSQTCRQFYMDLENNPVFYRVNTFQFTWPRADTSTLPHIFAWQEESLAELSEFLAAITPKRRAMIRYVHVAYDFNGEWDTSAFTRLVFRDPRYSHALPLLSQCKDIRELSFILPSNLPYFSIILVNGLNSAQQRHDIPMLWNLPFLRVKVAAAEGGHPLALGDSATISRLSWDRFRHDSQDHRVFRRDERFITQFNRAMFARYRGNERPQWFQDMDNPDRVQQAITAQGLDVHGENRIAQNPSQRTGPVSSRTRRKDTIYDHSLGVLRRDIPQYSDNGILTWNFKEVTGIRLNDSSELECEVIWDMPRRVPASGWVPVRALWVDGSESHLRAYYNLSIHARGVHHRNHCEQMKNMISPSYVLECMTKLCGGAAEVFSIDESKRGRGHGNVIKKKWEVMGRLWPARIKHEETWVIEEEKERQKHERERQKAERERQKAERKHQKAERERQREKAKGEATASAKGKLNLTKAKGKAK